MTTSKHEKRKSPQNELHFEGFKETTKTVLTSA